MATIHEAMFTVSWTTSYSTLLADGTGRLTTRGRHAGVFDSPGADLGLPWSSVTEPPSWNRFWSSYLGKPGAVRSLGADAAWEHLIPFQMWHQSDITGPADTRAQSRVLLYPCAISVIISVRVDGTWPVSGLAEALADLRSGEQWAVTDQPVAQRTLRGIATDLRDRAATLLVAGNETDEPAAVPEPGPTVSRTIAAPIAGEGRPAELALTDAAARSCVAGLAVLGPPGQLDDARLLGANSDTNLASRFYVLKNGHAIWHPTHVLQRPPKDPLGCLVRNQTDLAAHIEALGGTVAWAAEQVTAGAAIPVEAQPLIRTAAQRLRILHGGNSRNTYRSGVAMTRIQPMMESVDAVLNAL